MTTPRSLQEPVLELMRIALRGPTNAGQQATQRCVDLVADLERQLPMARSLGRMALRAAGTKNQRSASATGTPDKAVPTGAVEGYDGLTARDVIAIVRVAAPETVGWISAHETEGKGRVTILRAAQARSAKL